MLIGVAVEEIEICLDYKPITISTHDSRREGIVIHETSLLIYMYGKSPVLYEPTTPVGVRHCMG